MAKHSVCKGIEVRKRRAAKGSINVKKRVEIVGKEGCPPCKLSSPLSRAINDLVDAEDWLLHLKHCSDYIERPLQIGLKSLRRAKRILIEVADKER